MASAARLMLVTWPAASVATSPSDIEDSTVASRAAEARRSPVSWETEPLMASKVRDSVPTSSRPPTPVVALRSPAAIRRAATVSRRTGSTVRRPSSSARPPTKAVVTRAVTSRA